MKVKMFRASGNPVDPSLSDACQEEFRLGFDKLKEDIGAFGPEFDKALDEFESGLQEKYNDHTIITLDFPKTKKAWTSLLDKYGNLVITTISETNEHARAGDLVLLINDMEFMG